MTRMGDTTEIMGKTLLIGEMHGRVIEADAALTQEMIAKQSAIAQKNAANARSGQIERDNRRIAKENRRLNVELEEAKKLEAENRRLSVQLEETKKTLTARDALVVEWMHSNEAFKRLSKKYGAKLEITKEQRAEDLTTAILDAAEEDPDFQNTELAKDRRAALKGNKPT